MDDQLNFNRILTTLSASLPMSGTLRHNRSSSGEADCWHFWLKQRTGGYHASNQVSWLNSAGGDLAAAIHPGQDTVLLLQL